MSHIELIHEGLTHSVIGAFFEVSRTLGFGFLEHVYVASLTRELHDRGHDVGREVSVPILYKGEEVARQRLDMIVDGKLNPTSRTPNNSPPRFPSTPRSPRNPFVIVARGGDEPRC